MLVGERFCNWNDRLRLIKFAEMGRQPYVVATCILRIYYRRPSASL